MLNAIYYGFKLTNETLKSINCLFSNRNIKHFFFADFTCKGSKQECLLKELQENCRF